jgi:hypothetical protein
MRCNFKIGKHICLKNTLQDSKFCEVHKDLEDCALYVALYLGDYESAKNLIDFATPKFKTDKSQILEHIIIVYFQKYWSDAQLKNFPKIIQLLIDNNTPIPDFEYIQIHCIFEMKGFKVQERVAVIKPILERYKKIV